MKKLATVLLGVSVFMGLSGLSLFTDVGNSKVEAALVAQQTASTPAKSKVKSSLINMTGKYDNVRPGRRYGTPMPKEDQVIAGVPLGSAPDAIVRSLGTPDKTEYSIRGGVLQIYGGIEFFKFPPSTDKIFVKNRDAVTKRGVAVGDTLEKVYSLYGQPDRVNKGNDGGNWFYGMFAPRSDDMDGINFIHDGNRVTEIIIIGY
ncbi:hypothetical protein [Veillonella ratti]|uniref:hypothetical protein n=1 Tax=Veillonella ratti TaxID=103892 RepID=UPI000F8DF92D|nr:hypothetical protein [Veillonella ratti]